MKSIRPNLPLWKVILSIYIGAILTVCVVCAALLMSGWRPDGPSHMPSLEASVQQCEAAFGHPLNEGYNMEESHRWSQMFFTRGWSVIVSYDGRHRAEQFIFCKTQLPFMRPPAMNAAEQSALIEKFKESSTWTLSQRESMGSLWNREDGQAAAFYVESSRWLIFMNKAGWERFAKSAGLPTE